LADDLRLAPRRLERRSDKGALEGTASVRQRSQELELAALRVQVGIHQSEAEILRHEVHVRGRQITELHEQMGELVKKLDGLSRQTLLTEIEELAAAYKDLKHELHLAHTALQGQAAAFRGSLTWKIGRTVTKPLGTLKRLALRRRAA
jgi:chromosome segregation ATPase